MILGLFIKFFIGLFIKFLYSNSFIHQIPLRLWFSVYLWNAAGVKARLVGCAMPSQFSYSSDERESKISVAIMVCNRPRGLRHFLRGYNTKLGDTILNTSRTPRQYCTEVFEGVLSWALVQQRGFKNEISENEIAVRGLVSIPLK